MGLRDDDEQLFAERDLLDWAREAPRSPGSYDYAPTEEESAAYDYERRKWMERRPTSLDSYEEAHPSVGGYSGREVPSLPKPVNVIKKKKETDKAKAKGKKPVAKRTAARKLRAVGRKGRR